MVRILVVEDEVIVGLALREDLRDLGGHVIVTHDAEDALRQLSLGRFDAAIMDIALPGMRGDDLAKEFRRRFPDMPIILTTGLDQRELHTEFGADPRCEIVEKPHDFHRVRVSLERLGVRLEVVPAGG